MDEQPTPPNSPQQLEGQKPIAYDAQGRPLYAAPPISNPNPQTAPQFVHLSRSVDPVEQIISPTIKAKHDQSMKDFPTLNLSEAEYIVSAVQRHPIGLALPVGLTIFLVALTASLLINYSFIMNALGIFTPPPFGGVLLMGTLFIILILLGCYISVWIYSNNRFFLTNESVIQEIQSGLFSRNEQTVSLVNIEDASFSQSGIIQQMFNYGSIRLSTEGDETTYRFQYVSNPKQQIAILNNAVESFKNGRPVIND